MNHSANETWLLSGRSRLRPAWAGLADLRVEDAHLSQGYVKVLGKGNKERLVPIGRTCKETLLRWRDRYRPRFEFVESPFLFLDPNGGQLTVAALESIIRRASVKVVMSRSVYCHLLRHTFATNYLVRQVGNPLPLQQILGHTSLEMVVVTSAWPTYSAH